MNEERYQEMLDRYANGVQPKCCNRAVFESWAKEANLSGEAEAKFCTDCTRGFQAEMKLQGTCSSPNKVIRIKLIRKDNLAPASAVREASGMIGMAVRK